MFEKRVLPIADIRLDGRLRRPNPAKVQEIAQSIAQVGLLHPLLLSNDLYLLAGFHRLEALKLLGWQEAECRIVPYPYGSPEAGLCALDENLMRNELTALEQAEYLLQREEILRSMGVRAEKGGQVGNRNAARVVQNGSAKSAGSFCTTRELANRLGISERTYRDRLAVARGLNPRERDLIRGTPLANKPTLLLQIARIQDPERRRAVIRMMSGDSTLSVNEAVRRYRIEKGEIPAELDIIKPSNWWSFGCPKWRQEDFRGSIPGEIYANALYYFAPERGIAADGMAGSGMLRRVYEDRFLWQKERRFDLDIRLYDLYPREPWAGRYGIRQHDMTTPLPEPVDWLFIDPPYFRIAGFLEGELAKTQDYGRYCELMRRVIEAARDSLKPGGVFCLFTTPYIDITDPGSPFIDVPADMYRIALESGLRLVFRAYVSRGEQQRRGAGMMNLKAKRLRRMFSDVCELLVFRRGEEADGGH
ncbi:MAG: ParB N-terminal domain-containing protein [Candidatus Micrarchaeaceae archaeon]